MALVKYNNNSLSAITSTGLSAGAMTLISTTTASSSATLSITSGIDSTYPIYLFKFINIHPATDNTDFMFNGSDDDSSHSYDVTKTTTTFQAYHNEGDTDTAVGYDTSDDLAQSTAFQQLLKNLGTDNDQSASGELWLFNPSSTTFVKHFIAQTSSISGADYEIHRFAAGYANTTSAVDAVQFKMSSNNVDAGDICLYGIN